MALSPRRAALVALTLILATAGTAPVPAATRSRSTAGLAAAHPEVRELVRLVNARRRRVGCPPLRWDPTLARIARRHSADMARRGFFGHDNPDGDDPFDRLRDAGVEYTLAAENVAAGHRDASAVFDAWMRSRGHRANIERCGCTHHGIGLAENRWTHVFVRFRNSSW